MKNEAIKSYDLPVIQRAAEIIQKDPTRQLSAVDLADQLCISSFKLNLGFKQLYCQTVYQFRQALLLQMVMQLLEDTDLTLEQIAYKTGFDSRDSMSRIFRKKLCLSPKQWRKEKMMRPAPELTTALACLARPSLN